MEDRAPTAADFERLGYTRHVVTEALRLYPPAYMTGREALADCEIAGYRIPAGSTLFMSPWIMQRDPRYFDRPDDFIPDRWADGLARRLPRFAYFPFGGGPRVCIGNGFAMMEAVLVLAAMAQRFGFTLVPGATVKPSGSITLRPANGVPVRVERR